MSKAKNSNTVYLTLADESDDEEKDENDIVKIKLTTTTIETSFIQLYRYSPLFREKYFTKESRRYLSQDIIDFQNHFNINEDNIKLFFKLIQDENVGIINDNYRDLRKLSDFFQVAKLNKFLDKYSKNYLSDIDSIVIQILDSQLVNETENNDNDTTNAELEMKLSHRINECFQNSQFEKLPVSIIYRIVSKSCIKNISSDFLFDFINKSFEERYLLFHFLRIDKLSDERFDKLYDANQDESKSEFIYQNIPVDLNYLKSIKEERKNFESQIQTLKQQLENEAEKLNEKMNEYQIEINRIKVENNGLKTKNEQIQTEMNHINNENNELKTKNEQLQIKMNQIKDENNELKTKNEQIQTEINRINNENNELKAKNHQLQTEINNLFQVSIQHNPKYEFNGILSFLKSYYKERIFEIVDITALSSSEQNESPKNVIIHDSDSSKYFWSLDKENPWITFHFKKHKVIPKSYTVLALKDYNYPINWEIKGSNDNNNWSLIDKQNKCNLLKDYTPVTFNIDNDDSFSFIKMEMIGKNKGERSFYFIIKSFEIYGMLKNII